MAVTPGMASAGQDPVVNELESLVASLTGHEAALFLPTTTNGTVLAFMTHDVRGQLAVMEAKCHIFWVERLHVSQLGGAAPRLIRGARYGAMDPDEVEAVDHRDGLRLPASDRHGLPGKHPQRLRRNHAHAGVHAADRRHRP